MVRPIFFRGNFALLVALALVLILSECRGATVSDSTTTKRCYCLEEIVSDLYNPLAASFFRENEKEQIVVVEQRGVIKLVSDDNVKIMLDMKQSVVTSNAYGDQRGLLSAVPSPDFAVSGKIYVSYTRQDEGEEFTYVSEFQSDKDTVDKSSEKYLLRVQQPFTNKNGGQMFFGDDGNLYIITGDGGAQDDILGHAQNKNSFHGSVLRIDVKGGQDFTAGESGFAKTYKVPDDNPFVNMSNAKGELYAYGFRNIWGCSQDSTSRGGDGRIYCAETGTQYFDEINIIEKGKNYGWNTKEGTMCYNATAACDNIENEGLPIHEFAHSGSTALVGGYVYRGEKLTFLKDKINYIYGDVITGKLYSLEENPDSKKWTPHDLLECNISDCAGKSNARPLKHILAFAQDMEGELYLLMVDELKVLNPAGKMFKMRPSSGATSGFTFSGLGIIFTAFALLWTNQRIL